MIQAVIAAVLAGTLATAMPEAHIKSLPVNDPGYCTNLNSLVVGIIGDDPEDAALYTADLFLMSIALAVNMDVTKKPTHIQVSQAAKDAVLCFPKKST